MMTHRKPRNSSKINFTVSAIFHTVLILGVAFLAAREGMLGNKLKTLAATIVPKEKPKAPEPAKEKPPEPKTDTPKVAQAKPVQPAPAPRAESSATPPPATVAPDTGAPAANVISDIDFSDGLKQVVDSTSYYKQEVERTLRSNWNRPEDMEDDKFVAQAELSVDANGRLLSYRWVSGSGSPRWDESVKNALAVTKAIGERPPKGFPERFIVRFDVETQSDEGMQLGLR